MVVGAAGAGAGPVEAQPPGPDFQEVYDLIRAHLSGMSETELNRVAVEGLVSKLNPRVVVVGERTELLLAGGPLVKATNLFEGNIAYMRIARVEEGLEKAVRETYERLGTNKLSGLVLDLRYAGGDDYAAAAATAELFIAKERPLMDWGKGLVRSKEKSDALTTPVAVLVNGQTARAAEALAAVMRETGVGLLLGSNTSGQAMIAQEYALKNGQRLRVATAAIQIGETSLISAQGVKPDIQVEVSPQDEQAYYADSYKELARNTASRSTNAISAQAGGTNRTRRPRMNEAELVRERREGATLENEPASARNDAEIMKPMVRDPALARALDVLKGLALVRQSRP
jgi:C-terminal processing protease CtpA/Prc